MLLNYLRAYYIALLKQTLESQQNNPIVICSIAKDPIERYVTAHVKAKSTGFRSGHQESTIMGWVTSGWAMKNFVITFWVYEEYYLCFLAKVM